MKKYPLILFFLLGREKGGKMEKKLIARNKIFKANGKIQIQI
jgi:hypothetical protein